jgi:alkylation response protein AidB-like acyl-CoA dehydrogenase
MDWALFALLVVGTAGSMISFQPTEDEVTLAATLRRFAQDRMRPVARQCEEQGHLPDTLACSFWELGLALMNYSPDLGGAGLGQRTAVIAEEELAWGDAGIAVALPRPGLAGDVISGLECGLQSRWLSAFALDEPCFASAALCEGRDRNTLSATRTDGRVVLEGCAYAMPAAERTDWILVTAVLDDDLALLALPLRTAGLSFTLDGTTLGLRGSGFGTLKLDHCSVAPEMLLASGDDARRAFVIGLQRDVLIWTARLVGVSRAALEYAVEYAAERKTFGKRLAEHQVIAFMAADMGTAIDAARCLLWHAACLLDTAGPQVSDLVRSAAAFAAESAIRVTSDAVQILGGHGYVQDHPAEKWLRDARTMANVSNWLARLLVLFGDGR